MRNKSLALIVTFILFGTGIFAASPWATISYAEGKSFMLVRDGKTATYSVDSAEVFGMELRQGDVIQTASSTFLELSIHAVSASVQVAENTSFKCDADPSGTKVSGELYYGRVRAKVAKLAGSSSFKISTPTLVAGVRGTDFGCDVIAVRGSKPGAAVKSADAVQGSPASPATSSQTPLLNRVFCFEGTVAVTQTAAPSAGAATGATGAAGAEKPLNTVLISKNEMVEKVVTDASAPLAAEPLKKNALSTEVNEFWGARPFTESAAAIPAVLAESGLRTYRHAWPAGRAEKPAVRNLKIPAIAAASLILIGTSACIGTSYFSAHVDSNAVFVDPAFSSGLVMAGSGSVLALLSTLFD